MVELCTYGVAWPQMARFSRAGEHSPEKESKCWAFSSHQPIIFVESESANHLRWKWVSQWDACKIKTNLLTSIWHVHQRYFCLILEVLPDSKISQHWKIRIIIFFSNCLLVSGFWQNQTVQNAHDSISTIFGKLRQQDFHNWLQISRAFGSEES